MTAAALPRILYLFGPPASGKHTIARMLCERLPDAQLLHNHAYIDLVTQFFPFRSDSAKRLTQLIPEQIIREFSQHGQGTLITTRAPLLPPHNSFDLLRESLDDLVSPQQQVLVVWLNADRETLIERIHTRDPQHRRAAPSAIEEYVISLWTDFAHQLPPDTDLPQLTFDTTIHSSEFITHQILNTLSSSTSL